MTLDVAGQRRWEKIVRWSRIFSVLDPDWEVKGLVLSNTFFKHSVRSNDRQTIDFCRSGTQLFSPHSGYAAVHVNDASDHCCNRKPLIPAFLIAALWSLPDVPSLFLPLPFLMNITQYQFCSLYTVCHHGILACLLYLFNFFYVTVVCIPMTVGEIIYKEWIYGLFLCKTASYLQGVSVAASVLTITALSLDRYIAIQHPVKSRRISSTGHVKKVIICIWVIACGIMVPLVIVRDLTVHPIEPLLSQDSVTLTVTYCHEDWPEPHSRRVYDLFLFIFIYVVPGVMVVYSYSTTGCNLLMGTTRLHRQDSDIHQSNKVVAGRRRVARMLLLLALLFAFSWLPYYIILLYMDFTNSQNSNKYLAALSFALLLGHSHSAQNPVLYCLMNTNFRRTILALFKCKRLRSAELSRLETNHPHRPFRANHRSYGGVTVLSNRRARYSSQSDNNSASPHVLLISKNSDPTNNPERGPNYMQRIPEGGSSTHTHRHLVARYETNGQCVSIVENINGSETEDNYDGQTNV